MEPPVKLYGALPPWPHIYFTFYHWTNIIFIFKIILLLLLLILILLLLLLVIFLLNRETNVMKSKTGIKHVQMF